jgi:hypothetical protein
MRKGFEQKKWGFDLTNIGKPGQYFLPVIQFSKSTRQIVDFNQESIKSRGILGNFIILSVGIFLLLILLLNH